mmetsp:Transcript_5782/g.18934  ORF Transcript_5782/g.18934 Transcript_5782/m.18934 type:complete len:325 (+) Transcript_5782:887-1861(+)
MALARLPTRPCRVPAARLAGGRPTFRRLGASSVGGATFWGLVRLLTACETFDEVIRLTEMEGACSTNVDMQVGDIYGKAAASSRGLGLKSEVIAASFGKVVLERRGPMFFLRYLRALLRHYEEGFWLVVLAVVNSVPLLRLAAQRVGLVRLAESRAASMAMCGSFRAHDVALSLLRMVSNNIGHVSTLSAQQAGLRHIVFGGSFIRDHPFTIATISSAVRFYSGGRVQPLFLKHDGFVGAIGAQLRGSALAGSHTRVQPTQPTQPIGSEPAAAIAADETPIALPATVGVPEAPPAMSGAAAPPAPRVAAPPLARSAAAAGRTEG